MARRSIPNLKRRKENRKPKKWFFLFCEGKATEPNYFAALQGLYSGSLIGLEVVEGVGVPFSVAEAAVKKKKELTRAQRQSQSQSYEKDDEVWAIFDHDSHPKINQSIDICRGNSIGVAYSNPCFEIWLILNLADYDKSDDRGEVQRCLQKLRPEYDAKGSKIPNCRELIKNLQKAEERAACQLLRRQEEANPFGRPCTTVGHLTLAVRSAAGKSVSVPDNIHDATARGPK